MKILCQDCKHIVNGWSNFGGTRWVVECRHPKLAEVNISPINGIEFKFYANPYEVNKNLDCILFEEK